MTILSYNLLLFTYIDFLSETTLYNQSVKRRTQPDPDPDPDGLYALEHE